MAGSSSGCCLRRINYWAVTGSPKSTGCNYALRNRWKVSPSEQCAQLDLTQTSNILYLYLKKLYKSRIFTQLLEVFTAANTCAATVNIMMMNCVHGAKVQLLCVHIQLRPKIIVKLYLI